MAQIQFRSDDTSVWEEKFGNGSDGDVVISSNTTDSPIDSAVSGTSGQNTLTGTNPSFAPNQLVLVIQMTGANAGIWQFNKITSYSAGNIGLKYANVISFAGQAQIIVMKQYHNLTINPSVTWSAKAWNGVTGGILAFFVNGTYTNNGTLNLVGKGFRGGAGGAAGYSADNSIDYITTRSYQGESYYGQGVQSNNANYGGGGGSSGGGADGGNGGGGAAYATDGTDGGAGQGTPGYHGVAYGQANLVRLYLGSGGGGGRGEKNGWSYGGAGGRGGGILLGVIYTLVNAGSVLLNGEGGANATYTNTDGGGGGGGGSGGSGLLKYHTGQLGATLMVSTGGGGGAQGYGAGGNGGNGSSGRFHADYGISSTGTTNPSIDLTQDPIITITVNQTISAKADVRKLSVTPELMEAKARVKYTGVTKTVTAKARVLHIKSPTIQAKARILKTITRTVKALAFIVTESSYDVDSQRAIRDIVQKLEIDWKLNSVFWDETQHALSLEVERRLAEPLGGISLSLADAVLENITDRYTPTE